MTWNVNGNGNGNSTWNSGASPGSQDSAWHGRVGMGEADDDDGDGGSTTWQAPPPKQQPNFARQHQEQAPPGGFQGFAPPPQPYNLQGYGLGQEATTLDKAKQAWDKLQPYAIGAGIGVLAYWIYQKNKASIWRFGKGEND
jgi:hypothetical protein